MDPLLIVDYGVGNVGSVVNMLRRIGASSELSGDVERIRGGRRLILPGVGAFDPAAAALHASGLATALRDAVSEGALVLGICLGGQLLLEGSEEGEMPGLGLVAGRARRLGVHGERVPHMGWNVVRPAPEAALFDRAVEQRFYFAHSYYMHCEDAADVAATTCYGGEFACAIQRGRVFGAQFHPEKSHRFGFDFLRRFSELEC
jgi:imidazole glycerol-phosphate synthase subunit HisH